MAKIDQMELAQQVQKDVIKNFGVEDCFSNPELMEPEIYEKTLSFVLEQKKKRLSQKLSTIDALANASIILGDDDLFRDVLKTIDDCVSVVQSSLDSIITEGGIEDEA